MTAKAFLIRILLLFITVTPLSPVYSQETEADLSAKAQSLFEQQKFVEATPLYLRLLALNPLSHDYNFRYGTCLLFNSYKKQDAFKYLNYSVQDAATDVSAYYYLGRAYHLNYQFNEAIKNYELYKQKSGPKPKAGLDVDRQIEMCQNGKRLLTTITDIIVLEKKEIDAEKFFRIYDLPSLGGDLLVAAEYQSKIDKKKGHVPLIYFPSDPKAIYYSSYGDTDNGQKDIYVRKKLPNGSWSLPQPVHGDVNTKYDEDYPYMHPNGEYLYFCSRGHNSMGGYDVFRSRIDPETGSFGPPENMDFAISSPDDDLFYVVDSLDATAYFASARQSTNGKLYVYKVRVERVPLQLAVIKGNFSSAINPANKKVSISVTDYASGEKIGVFNSNDKGNYLITFPKGGKYTYEIRVEGKEQVHKYLVSIPFSKEFRPLKQKMIEELNEETEVVRVLDLFNEDVDDIAGVLAEVIKMRSELNPNANQFDLEQLDEQKTNAKILAELGFENASPQQIASHFDAVRESQEARVQLQANLVNGGNASAAGKAQQAGKLQEEAKDLVNKANGAVSEQQKFDLLQQAQEKLTEAKNLKQEARTLIAFADSVSAGIAVQQENLQKITAIDSEIRKAVADNNMSDLKEVLTGNTAFIAELSKSESGDATEGLVAGRTKVLEEKKSLEQQKSGYQSTSDKLTNELSALNKSLSEAKSKDKPAIQSSIDSKTAEKELVQQEITRLDKKIVQAAGKEEEIRKEIEFLNGVTSVQSGKTVSAQEAKAALANADDPNSRTLEAYVNKQVEAMKKNTSLAASQTNAVQLSPADVLADYENKLAVAGGSTPVEKLQSQNRVDEQLLSKIGDELAETDLQLAANPDDQQAKDKKQALTTLKSATEKQVSNRNDQIAKEQSAVATTEKPSAASELKRLSPGYETAISSATGTTPVEKLQSQNRVDEQLLSKIDNELAATDSQLAANPNDQQAKDKKQALTTLKSATEKQLSNRNDQIAKEQSAVATTEKPSAASELKRLSPGYETAISSATGTTPVEKLQSQNRVDEQLLSKIGDELAATDSQLAANPNDQQAKDKKQALTTLKSATEKQVSDRNDQISKENSATVFETTPSRELEKIFPDYESQRASLNFSSRKEQLQAENSLDEQLVRLAKEEQAELEGQLLRNPQNTEAKARFDALELLVAEKQEAIESRRSELTELDMAVVESSPVEERITRLRPEHTENIEKIMASSSAGAERNQKLLNEDEALLKEVNSAIEKTESQLGKQPESESLKQELALLEEVKFIQEAQVSERKLDMLAAARQTADTAQIIGKADPRYASKEAVGSVSEQVKAEKLHQEKLQAAINSNQKQLQKSFNADLTVQNEILSDELAESKTRLGQLQSPEATNATSDAKLRADLGTNYERLMVSSPKDNVQAKTVLDDLKEYRVQLQDRLGEMDADHPERPLVEEQLAAVRKRIGIVEADLDAMTHTAGTTNAGSAIEKRTELEQQLTSPGLSVSEKKKIRNELAGLNKEIDQATENHNRQQLTAAHAEVQTTADRLRVQENRTELSESILNNSVPVAEGTTEEQLQQAEERKSLLTAVASFNEVSKKFREENIVIESRESLLAEKRRFGIEIGELEREIQVAGQDPKNSGKVSGLQCEKSALELAVKELDEMLQSVANDQNLAKEATVSSTIAVPYERELALAAEPQYIKIKAQAQNVEDVRKELAYTEKEMDAVRREIATEQNSSKREGFIAVLKALDEQESEYGAMLTREKARLDETISASGLPKDEIYNLLSRDVEPNVQQEEVLPIPEHLKEGFAIVENRIGATSARDLKMEDALPGGLVYRVQVGAFAKPVPEDRFREFTPVTGEKLPSGITRYMAGYFSQRQMALRAMNDIRALGYTDAFPVAYCDGERISLAEAKRLEEAGLCKAVSQDSLVMEIVQAQQEKAGIQPVIAPKPGDYNKAAGAVPAEAVEERQGLFFTVQVGVYNKPATSAQLREITPLITKRLPNGQIRYSSGIFSSANAAKPKRQEAVLRGIEDAFIVAYYKGERITLQEANSLLAEQGTAILETAGPEYQLTELDSARTFAAENPATNAVSQSQLVSSRTYAEYPGEELSKLNVNGNYYYDPEDRRIKSVPVLAAKPVSADTSLQIVEVGRNFELKPEAIVSTWAGSSMNGALADWLLHATVPYRYSAADAGFELRFEVPGDRQDELTIELKRLGAIAVTTERD